MALTTITISTIDCISTGIGNWVSARHDGHAGSPRESAIEDVVADICA